MAVIWWIINFVKIGVASNVYEGKGCQLVAYLCCKLGNSTYVCTLDISKIFCWFWYFTMLSYGFGQLLGKHWSRQKHAWMLSYFAQSQYILVRLGWSGWMGRKSMVMCKISTTPNQASMLQIVPIMCPTPQPSVVKNWSQQEFFLRYLMYIH